MKNTMKWLTVLAAAAATFIAAGHPGEGVAEEQEGRHVTNTKEVCYTASEVTLLMELNHWPEEQAMEVLGLACGQAANGH